MLLLDGNKLSTIIRKEILAKVIQFCQNDIRPPHLAAVIVGDNPASQAYVRNKMRACEEVGFASSLIKKPLATTQSELLDIIAKLNEDDQLTVTSCNSLCPDTSMNMQLIWRSIR